MSSTETNGAWHHSIGGLVLFGIDMVLLVALIVGTTSLAGTLLATAGLPAWTPPVAVPGFIYLVALVGAMGYIFTMLVRDFDRSSGALVRYNLRLPAALPLAAGIYFLAAQAVPSEAHAALAATAFATGLLVNTAYIRIRDLAVRLLSAGSDPTGRPAATGSQPEAEDGAIADGGGRG